MTLSFEGRRHLHPERRGLPHSWSLMENRFSETMGDGNPVRSLPDKYVIQIVFEKLRFFPSVEAGFFKSNRYKSRPRKDPKGLVTIPFLFAFLIVMFLLLSFFRLSLTLTYVSVAQYITYSSARRLSLGDESLEQQRDAGTAKYTALKGKLLSDSDWFTLGSPTPGLNLKYQSVETGHRNLFYGVFADFTSNAISFRIPFLAEEGDQGLTAEIGSYLGREPSKDECQKEFYDKRKGEIQDKIGPKYPGLLDNIPNASTSKPDNGC